MSLTRSHFEASKKEAIVFLLNYKRRKVLNDIIIASFGRAVHCSIKRGILSDRVKAAKMVDEWTSGLPLVHEPRLNCGQVELVVDLFFFFGKN